MRDMHPLLDIANIASALKDARKLESIVVAQQHLQVERNPAKSLLLELGSQDSETSSQANATASGTRDLMEVKSDELTAQVKKLIEELNRLHASCSPHMPGSENWQVTFWYCVLGMSSDRAYLTQLSPCMLKNLKGQLEDRGRQKRIFQWLVVSCCLN